MSPVKLLGDWILDSDGFDGFVERREAIKPKDPIRTWLWIATERTTQWLTIPEGV